MLISFLAWAKKIVAQELEIFKKDMSAEITESAPSDNPSVRLDIDTQDVVARLTFWHSGDYNAEVIHFHTERMIYSSVGKIKEGENLPDVFSSFLDAIANA
jgi:hypothetical protein